MYVCVCIWICIIRNYLKNFTKPTTKIWPAKNANFQFDPRCPRNSSCSRRILLHIFTINENFKGIYVLKVFKISFHGPSFYFVTIVFIAILVVKVFNSLSFLVHHFCLFFAICSLLLLPPSKFMVIYSIFFHRCIRKKLDRKM